jgi:hypothetical protein
MAREEINQEQKSCIVECCASGDGLAEAIARALAGREHMVMVRVNADLLKHLDMLVESGICKSRSSAATFMIHEGIKANTPLFERISEVTEQITALRGKLRGLAQDADEDS